MDQLQAAIDDVTTDFTSTVHRTPYAAISPTRSQLSKAGKTVLVTGGGSGIGKAIARNFALASAATVIIVARQADRLEDASEELAKTAEGAKSPTKFIARSCDITNSGEVTALWEYLAAQGIKVDVLVLNAAKFSPLQSLFELGIEEVWSHFEANVKGPLHFAELFSKQDGEGQKFLLNVTTGAIHTLQNPVVAVRPVYSLTKASGTLAVQILANTITPDKMQIVSFHPGMIYGLGWAESGITEDMIPFDDVNLPGAFAVWAASKEAKFLHGRYVFASWDVDDISMGETRRLIEENTDYLRIAVTGLKGHVVHEYLGSRQLLDRARNFSHLRTFKSTANVTTNFPHAYPAFINKNRKNCYLRHWFNRNRVHARHAQPASAVVEEYNDHHLEQIHSAQ